MMFFPNRLKCYQMILLGLIPVVSLLGCGSSSSSGGQSSPSQSVAPYCTPQTIAANAITITGRAGYFYRKDGNQEVVGPKDIRHAEVVVRNSSGTLIQCGHTDGSGLFSLQVPRGSQDLTLSVQSRANNNQLKAYVLDNPNNNRSHRVSRSFTPDQNKSIGNIQAPATGSLQGGAFNILDKLLDANDFLREQTQNCASIHSSCTPVDVAPLVRVYWEPGQDPGRFFQGVSDVSFYIPGSQNLYLLGGKNGNVDHSDTDHFDNTIILHEYAHFLEDVYSVTDSPGGPHNGNTILDPRLAWSEGWANYFQAAVTGEYRYLDTSGTIEGNAINIFDLDLEFGNAQDAASTLGEGNFREFSITRSLVDFTDENNECDPDDSNFTIPPSFTCPVGVTIDNETADFGELWTLFSSDQVGFRQSTTHFRDIGLLYHLHSSLNHGSNWADIQSFERHRPNRQDYANTLTTAGGGCSVEIQAQDISPSQRENGTPANSNQFASNDFYRYVHPGGSFSLSMTYTTDASNPADLDLYLYRENYRFGNSADVVAFSENVHTPGSTSGSESFSIGSLSAGVYMINISVFTGGGLSEAANYNLTINGESVCPQTP